MGLSLKLLRIFSICVIKVFLVSKLSETLIPHLRAPSKAINQDKPWSQFQMLI